MPLHSFALKGFCRFKEVHIELNTVDFDLLFSFPRNSPKGMWTSAQVDMR